MLNSRTFRHLNCLQALSTFLKNKMLSYRRETTLQGAL